MIGGGAWLYSDQALDWISSRSAETGRRKVFTVEELSRFTGGHPLNLTKIAEAQSQALQDANISADSVTKEEGVEAKKDEENSDSTTKADAKAEAEAEAEAEEEKEDAFVDPNVPIYLAILGRVFDVSKGKDFYGPGAGGYSGFAGRDGSRAFVTGKFDDLGLNDDIQDLTDEQIFSIFEWLDFYTNEDKYVFVGYVEGRHVDAAGEKTEYHKALVSRMSTLKRRKQQEKDAKKGYPSCNTRWESGKGTKIWCDEGRLPRKWFMSPETDDQKFACHCFADPTMPPSRGRIEVYNNCEATASECKFADGDVR